MAPRWSRLRQVIPAPVLISHTDYASVRRAGCPIFARSAAHRFSFGSPLAKGDQIQIIVSRYSCQTPGVEDHGILSLYWRTRDLAVHPAEGLASGIMPRSSQDRNTIKPICYDWL